MVPESAVTRPDREDVGPGGWPEVYRVLRDRAPESLTARDLETLADAAWWLSRVEESLAVRRKAHAAHVAAGDLRRAGYNAWMLATEYGFIGRPALAAGWLTKARRHLADQPECVEQGFLAFAEAGMTAEGGDLDGALRLTRHMVDLGVRCDSADVTAMGRLLEGQLLIAAGETSAGMALIDEVMCDVMEGATGDLATGWLYCLAVPICFELCDLARAVQWNAAAMDWCATLPAGTPFHGLCRVHHVELLSLGGAWEQASAEAARACHELMDYHPNMAGEAFYVAGELRRRRGDLDAAEQAFLTAHQLGRDPQPGLALLRLAQGRPDVAAAALASCLAGDAQGLLRRARLLAARTQVEVARGELAVAREAAHELETLASGSSTALLDALSLTAGGAVAVAAGETMVALERLRGARTLWLQLELPFEAAETRLLLAAAYRAAGDPGSADLEVQAARTVFERLGSAAGLRRADELLRPEPGPPGGLTVRQLDVLRLVAAGRTNRQIAAELVISEHTVSRHVENIYARLGVSSRAAAATFAHEHQLV
jgi:DNA-binding NarL/FixJ family response regulator